MRLNFYWKDNKHSSYWRAGNPGCFTIIAVFICFRNSTKIPYIINSLSTVFYNCISRNMSIKPVSESMEINEQSRCPAVFKIEPIRSQPSCHCRLYSTLSPNRMYEAIFMRILVIYNLCYL